MTDQSVNAKDMIVCACALIVSAVALGLVCWLFMALALAVEGR
jgi:hypothetical protein